MKKKLIVVLTFLLAAVPGFSQKSQSVNSIKRNSQYLYAEATMETVEDAYDVAKELLVGSVKDYASGKKAFRDKNILVKDIASRCDSIQLRRGEMYKVFLYVKKSDIIDVAENVTVIGEAPGVLEPQREQKEQAAATTIVSTPVVKDKDGDPSLRLPVAWQQDVIDRLLAASSYDEARAQVSRLRAESKIKRAGPEKTCRDRSAAFWLVGRDGQVVTVLGPGAGERTDFRNLSKTTLTDYSGMDLYWFTLAK